MRTEQSNPTANTNHEAPAWFRGIARALLPLLSLVVTLQPMVASAAPSPSLLMQEPRFVDVSVASNVIFMMDDSASMADIRLPVPPQLNPEESLGGNVTTRGGLIVERVNEWIYRSAALNPLYYNPAITYKPWNDNGRAGLTGRFTNATTAMNQQSNGFREGLVRQDMRYAGPNYNYLSFNGGNRLATTGANPQAVPTYLQPTRPLSGGFAGTVDRGRNQDIFSSPFVFVTSTAPVCTASVPVTSTPQPTVARTSSAQPSTPRTTTAPSSTVAQPSTARTQQAQSFTGRTTQTPSSTVRPTEYRVEQRICGSYGPWFVSASPPSTSFCTDGETTRVALVQSRLQSCPSGTTTSGSNCLSCNSGFSISGSTCLSNCPSGTVGSNSTQCFSACPSGFTQVSLGTCASSCPSGTVGSNATTCFQACPTGTAQAALGTCATCAAGSTLSGGQCLSNCPGGTVAQNSSFCYSACPAGTAQVGSGGTCRTICPSSFSGQSLTGSNSTTCFYACASGTASGGTCNSCPTGATIDVPMAGQCCTTFSAAGFSGCPYLDPTRCTSANYWYPQSDTLPAPARFFVFVPVDLTRAPTTAELSNPANYERREINRDAPRYQATFDKPYPNNDPTQDRTQIRRDCGTGTTCTWAQEAQNFANWYTYYRTRLFSAVAVTAESLSSLTRAAGLDSMRLGYGSINYFPNGANPFPNVNPALNGRLPSTMTVDGQSSVGAVVRGVRPFTEVSPPPSPGSNNRRQEVFDWLFSLREVGATPNREAIDAVGRYLARDDNRGPWIQASDPTSLTNWVSSEDPSDHIPCRRNYTIMITDGEWTNAPIQGTPSQPIISDPARAALPAGLASQGSPTNALTNTGPLHTPVGSAALVASPYRYDPAAEPQFSGGAGTTTNTLSDVALYYWSRDLRTDLANNIKPNASNRAFWQHLTPYIVGYGINASRDNATTRGAIAAATPITWPSVRLENRPTEDPRTISSDRDTAQVASPSTPATQLTCNYDPITNPSGCGRVDDTFRAAMAARADFLTATDVSSLAASVASAFARIVEVEGTATSVGGRSSSLRAGDLLYFASFVTNRWTGKIDAFNAVAWFDAVRAGTAEPAPVATTNFPSPNGRNILTSTARLGSGVAFNFASLSAAQRTQLGNSAALVDYLRGNQSGEIRNGGTFRDRDPGAIMGDIVNTSPLYSKAPDDLYTAARRPTADTNTATGAANAYRDHVQQNQASRPATVYVSSNSGMLHGFDAATLQERFAYVPRAVYPILSQLVSPGYLHRYFVDGPIVQGDVYINGAWRTVVVSTTGAGPKGIFALDVTQRTGSTARNVDTSDVLWDVTATDAVANIADLGNITQPGVIGSARDGNWYYFVGNGWESPNDKAVLLAIRISDGAIISIPTDNVGGPNPSSGSINNQPNGLGGVTPVYDSRRNIIAIYAGDRQGRLWKFDLTSAATSGWVSSTGTTPLFQATDSLGKRQPISAAPRLMAHPLGGRFIAVGTGRLTEVDDPSDTSLQTMYGLWERNTNSPTPISKTELRQFTLTETGTQANRNRVRALNGVNALNWNTDRGWYLNLHPTNVAYPPAGERVIVTPAEDLGFINVTSFEPIAGADKCQGGGQSFFYRFDVTGNFQRVGFRGLAANVVGVEMPGSLAGYANAGKPSAPDTTGGVRQAQISDIVRRALGASGGASGATNACAGGGDGIVALGKSNANVPSATQAMSCLIPAQRVQRDMPRGRR